MDSYKILLIVMGTISLGIGIAGVVIPGLPTTPFLLLTAGLYVRSSDKLYNKLLATRFPGNRIRRYREKGGMYMREKIWAISLMWIMIGISAFFFLDSLVARLIIACLGITGTLVMGLLVRTVKE